MPELIANENGTIEGKFMVPANIPAGTIKVDFTGDQGSLGTASYTSSGTITTQQRRTVTTVTYNRIIAKRKNANREALICKGF